MRSSFLSISPAALVLLHAATEDRYPPAKRHLAAFTLIMVLSVGTLFAQSAAWPPFYRQPHEQGTAQSMVFGPTDLQGSRLGNTRERMQPLSPTPQCASSSGTHTLRAYRGLQSATKNEADGLGVRFQQADGSAAPFLTGQILLWRAGQYGTCTSVGGATELVYGTDLVVAFLLAPDQALPSTQAQMEREIRRRKVIAVGVTLNGLTATPALQKKIQGLTSDVLQSGSAQRFTDLQDTWSTIHPNPVPVRILGVLENR